MKSRPLSNAVLSEGPNDALEALRALAKDLQDGSRAANTRRSYASAFGSFQAWCDAHHLASLPASSDTVALFVAHLAQANRKVSTIDRSLAAISQVHLDAGFPSPRSAPAVRRTLKGARRRADAPSSKRALTVAEIIKMVCALGVDLAGLRDRALLTLGFASGLRRSELVALDVGNLSKNDGALVVTVVRSKTDQIGIGRRVRVVGSGNFACPVSAIDAWLEAAGLTQGALFRRIRTGGNLTASRLNAKTVERVVKRAADLASLDPAAFSGHSLRSGFATAQTLAGVPERILMQRLGHASPTMTRRYIRLADEY